MKITFLESIAEFDRTVWQELWQTDYPFIQFDFLNALEASACVSAETGWQPQHLIAWQDGKAIAAMPLYLKSHSYGEYVFDWAWADAYQRYGLNYYPKLINAIPFTPATGPRIAFAQDVDRAAVQEDILLALTRHASTIGASSVHTLFPDAQRQLALDQSAWVYRRACQFHWFNRDYATFDDFLQTFNARKRKSLKRERRKVEESQLELRQVEGVDITSAQWEEFYRFYHLTYFKRSGRQGYLNYNFFCNLAQYCSSSIMMVQAYHEGNMVAGALFFKDSNTLFGRYWGCSEEFDALHFEACYYQGIEYAIKHSIKRFDPGAQGEHKIQRGFEPIEVGSYHWLAQDDFVPAIKQFAAEEAEQMHGYQQEMSKQLPFK
jgi:predicted N-acyltransferase